MNGALQTLIRCTPRGRRAAIFCFHDLVDGAWFEALVDAWGATGEFVSIGELCRRHVDGSLTGFETVVTFDDGFRSLLRLAHPVLRDRKIPYAFFVSSRALSDGPAPWFVRAQDLLQRHSVGELARFWDFPPGSVRGQMQLFAQLKEMPLAQTVRGLERAEERHGAVYSGASRLLSREEVAALSQESIVTLGSHTHRHPILSALRPEDQEREIRTGIEVLEELTGRRPAFFAYPNGTPLDYDRTTREVLERLGIVGAVTTVQRPVRRDDDRLTLPRIGIGDRHSTLKVACKRALPWPALSGWREAHYRRRIRAQRKVR